MIQLFVVPKIIVDLRLSSSPFSKIRRRRGYVYLYCPVAFVREMAYMSAPSTGWGPYVDRDHDVVPVRYTLVRHIDDVLVTTGAQNDRYAKLRNNEKPLKQNNANISIFEFVGQMPT